MENIGIIFDYEFKKYNLFFPLALSFFTLQQITYLVDVYEKNIRPQNLVNHFLFVSFFPQLIAGPIVYYKNLVPQFKNLKNHKINFNNIALGIFYFSVGYFKKSIGDHLGNFANSGFTNYEYLYLIDAWVASLSFTLQLYFDFSGYTSMALGIALFFNIILPNNFNNPLMSTNMVSFWKNWHITLTSFIFSYVYRPLLGIFNNLNFFKIMVVTFICFLITGLWHGASWGFLIFGGINGFAVILNHIFNKFNLNMPKIISWSLTFVTFNISCIFFRSDNLIQAFTILKTMFNLKLFYLPIRFQDTIISNFDFIKFGKNSFYSGDLFFNIKILLLLLVGLFFFKKINVMDHFKINYYYAFIIVIMIVISIFLQSYSQPFIYFKF